MITILTLGKLKETYWRHAEEEYLKRISPYAKINFIEIKEEPFRDGDDREKIKLLEAEKIKKHLPDGGVIIALHEQGTEYDSPQFAKFLESNTTRGEHLIFIVGGPLGLHKHILSLAQHKLSLSRLTFPHQMVRTILLEQIYRGICITKGKQYHY